MRQFEYPKKLIPLFNEAIKIEIFSVAYLISIVICEYLAMSNIQSMKTVWLDDMISLVAPISFLITTKIFKKPANQRFRYGFHNIIRVAFLMGSFALTCIGLFLLIDGILYLMEEQRPIIPYVEIFHFKIWSGYLIILIMLYKIIVPYFLSIIKIRLAKELHDKTLFVDGHTNRDDYIAAIGVIIGIFTVSAGYWWSDAVIAIFISVGITYDGLNNTKNAIYDLIDEVPTLTDGTSIDPLVKKIDNYIQSLPWVEKAQVKIREEGHVCFGEALIVPKTEQNLTQNIDEAVQHVKKLHWRIHEFLICPVTILHNND